MTKTSKTELSNADKALMDAIDSDIAGEPIYPNGSVFIDAEQSGAGRAIAKAAAEGRAVVLCSADGSRQLLYPSEPAAA